MNPSRIFILRPVATSLIMLAILLLGIFAYRLLPIAALPQVDYPIIQVVTLYPGASPQVITSSITAPLETQFGQMPGLKQMLSTSSGGASVITLQFSLNLNLDIAEQQVQAAINTASSFLPTDLPAPPIYSKVNPADPAIMTIAITSSKLTLPKLEDLVDTRVAQKISQISGVGLVSIAGGQRPAVRVRLNSTALAAYSLDSESIRTTIAAANINSPKGSFDGAMRAATINANDQISDPEEYKKLIVGYKNGAAIRLGDVAEVIDGVENDKLQAWSNNIPAIILNIQRQPGSNVIEVVDNIKKLLPNLQNALPNSVDMQILTDRTVTIRAAVSDAIAELFFAIILVVIVIYVFLRNISATIIPAVAIPISLLGTFAVIYLAGFSINNLTLMALIIATGFVVDDAIVMIENIARYLEAGDSPMQAALKGSKQIGFTIISLTFSLIAVLIPLLFMGDVVGRLFHEFAITLAVAILISAVVSLTLTPMMCSRILRPGKQDGESQIERSTLYSRLLTKVLQKQGLTLAVAGATLVLTVILYIYIPKGFFPSQDTGIIAGISQAPESVSFLEMAKRQNLLAEEILKDKDVASLSSFIGVDGVNTTLNSGRISINLKPHGKRDNVGEVIKRLNQSLENIAGIKLYLQPVQDITIETSVSRAAYQLSVQDANTQDMEKYTGELVENLAKLPQIKDVSSNLQSNGLQAYVDIDRITAARLGVSTAEIDNALYNAFGQRLISTIFTQSNQYRVVLEIDNNGFQGIDILNKIYISGLGGKQVPLAAVAKISERKAPLAINHNGQFPAATISFNITKGYSLGDAVAAIKQNIKEMNLPESLQTSFQGSAASFQASLNNNVLLILAAIVTMYIVLGVLYESYIHPVTILSTLPSAGIGALISLAFSANDLGVIGIIGIILLIGIVKKNAIMMIDFAIEAQREQGLSAYDAIYQACLLRFRPIMMTTAAALIGALPLMLGSGVGSELRQPLGITMFGGLLVSQVLTLFTTPVIYLAFDRLTSKRA